MVRPIALALLVVAAVPLLGAPLWIATHRADLESLEDVDLEVRRLELAPEENGYPHLLRAVELLDRRDDETSEGAWPRNAPALAALERALAARHLQLPARTRGDSADELLHLPSLAKLAGAEGRALAARGQPAAGLDRALLGMRVGRRLAEAHGVAVLDLLAATATQGASLTAIDAIVRDMSLTPAEARELSRTLEQLRVPPAGWARAWAGDYQRMRGVLLELDVEGGRDAAGAAGSLGGGDVAGWAAWLLPTSYLWQPNRTLTAFADHYRELQRSASRDCVDATFPQRRGLRGLAALLDGNAIGEVLFELAALLDGNAIGEVLFELAAPSSAKLDARRCLAETRISLAQVAVAARAYWEAHARLPDGLHTLVPRYLDSVPVDRFEGRPLRYSSRAKRVYSIGVDFEDAGGAEEGAPFDKSEPTVSLAF